jgi:uncharacterized membrane protein
MDLAVSFIYAIGSVICHQRPERSFVLDGHQLPVCARCAGLYLSGALAFAGWWAFKLSGRIPALAIDPPRALRVGVIAAIPTLLSLTLAAIGVWDGSNITRALLAVPLGAAAGAIVAAVTTKDLR